MLEYEWGAVQVKETDNLDYVKKVDGALHKTDMVYSLITGLVKCSELYEQNQERPIAPLIVHDGDNSFDASLDVHFDEWEVPKPKGDYSEYFL